MNNILERLTAACPPDHEVVMIKIQREFREHSIRIWFDILDKNLKRMISHYMLISAELKINDDAIVSIFSDAIKNKVIDLDDFGATH